MTPGSAAEQRKGLIFGIAAYGMWGLFPLYWPLLKPASAIEILANRMVWSLAVVAFLLTLRRNWAWTAEVRRSLRKLLLLAAAAIVVSVNWGVYIWGVNQHEVVETSLGYFINPLVTVMFGVVILRERLRPTQWLAVAIGGAAIVELVIGYGHVPWIALTLAASFGSYGLFKKLVGVPAVESMAVETAFQFLPALAYLSFLQTSHTAAFGHVHWTVTTLLALAGVVTAVPLICFTAAANRLPLSTMGLLQFLAPVLQLSCGVFIAHETVPNSEWAGFAIVWIALALLTYDSFAQARSRRHAVPSAPVDASPPPAASPAFAGAEADSLALRSAAARQSPPRLAAAAPGAGTPPLPRVDVETTT